jgi:bifunctional non-homologous end joining protein LigD
MKDYVWLKPEIVAEIKFTEWTTGSVLRHPEFVLLRDDESLSKSTQTAITRFSRRNYIS